MSAASRVARRPLRGFVLGVLALGGAAAVTLGADAHPPAPVLVVEDVSAQRTLLRERVSVGETFVIDYVHSSERVPVRGTFRVDADRQLTVVETAFAGFGPGLPELGAGDEWRIEQGMIVHRPAAQRFAELPLRVLPITRHRLRTPAGEELDLSALMGRGGSLRVLVR
jgi:hypothetical protein